MKKRVVSLIVLCIVLLVVILQLVVPLKKVTSIDMEVSSSFTPVVYQGNGLYFVVDEFLDRTIILNHSTNQIFVSDQGTVKKIIGIPFWVKSKKMGVSYNSMKIDEEVTWQEKSVLFTLDGIKFRVRFDSDVFNEEDYTRVDKLVKGSWSNMTSWIFLYDPAMNDYQESAILEISFHQELESLAQGGLDDDRTDQFLHLVNAKYSNNIELHKYAHKFKTIELIYADGSRVLWDYGFMKSPSDV